MNRAKMWKGARLALAGLGLASIAVMAMAQTAPTISQAPAQSPSPSPVYPGYGMMGGWGPGYGYGMEPGMMGYGMWFGGLVWILILIGIIAVIVFLMRSLSVGRSDHPGDDGRTALKLLSERYARGEIGREEYLEKKRDLGG